MLLSMAFTDRLHADEDLQEKLTGLLHQHSLPLILEGLAQQLDKTADVHSTTHRKRSEDYYRKLALAVFSALRETTNIEDLYNG
jgi:hypothetical protein